MQVPFTTHNEDPAICALNTHGQGTLTGTSYDQLYLVFGQHMWVDGPDKVDWEWIVEFPCGTVASIYNYKNGPNYCGAGGMNRHQVTEWNVAGGSAKAYHLVEAALAGRTYKYECLGETLSKAESLGWKNALDDIEVNDDIDPGVIDSAEADALESIADAGWIVYGMDGGVV